VEGTLYNKTIKLKMKVFFLSFLLSRLAVQDDLTVIFAWRRSTSQGLQRRSLYAMSTCIRSLLLAVLSQTEVLSYASTACC